MGQGMSFAIKPLTNKNGHKLLHDVALHQASAGYAKVRWNCGIWIWTSVDAFVRTANPFWNLLRPHWWLQTVGIRPTPWFCITRKREQFKTTDGRRMPSGKARRGHGYSVPERRQIRKDLS